MDYQHTSSSPALVGTQDVAFVGKELLESVAYDVSVMVGQNFVLWRC